MEAPTLSAPVRASLPPEVRAYLASLEAEVALLTAKLAELEPLVARVAELEQRRAVAEARAQQHSGNSSRPPSSDPPDAPGRPAARPSGRRRGGQPGHRGHHREWVPPSDVNVFVEHYPEQCPGCQAPLPVALPDTAEPQRQQVWDVPVVVEPVITEHRYHTVTCPHCQTAVSAPRPADVPSGAFGPQLTALVGLLHGRYRLSAREIQALLADLWRVPLGLGSVPTLYRQVGAALAGPYAEVQAQVQTTPHAHVDETSWKQAGQRRWLWVAVGTLSTLFLVTPSRAGHVLASLLGEAFVGIVHSDRYKAYLRLPVQQRQLCWAHLKRNLVAYTAWRGAIGDWGADAVALVDRLFDHWHAFQAGAMERAGLQAAMAPVQADFRALLERADDLPGCSAPGLGRELLALWPALWTFVTVPGVAPTNNTAEQALRPAVLWRKGCFGADSTSGNEFVSRSLTAAATCRQQQRSLFAFLTDAVRAHQTGQPAPKLFPASAPAAA